MTQAPEPAAGTWRVSEFAPDETALAALARASGLSKSRLKDAMTKGAVWLSRGKRSERLRRSTTRPRQGDILTLHFNPAILALTVPGPGLIADERDYSVWHKPAGMLAQGTREGDHCALLRIAGKTLQRECFLVHRLDREASGLMLIAHRERAARELSRLFAERDGTLVKTYRVEVRGVLPEAGQFDAPLDGKAALTRFTRTALSADSGNSQAEVTLVTGRKHQIRRHFAAAGHPVLGDPRYGEDNRDRRGLQLVACRLAFTCPLSGKARDYRL